jgi:metallophosphoesterase superfamily enzyme
LNVLAEEIREIYNALSPKSRLTFLVGNHDRDLQKVFEQWSLPIELVESRTLGEAVLVHGDKAVVHPHRRGRIIMGHEHPAISIGDGVTTSQKCPCFLISETVFVLPAFSRWAAGTNIRAYPFMSEAARAANFTQAIAICGEKLLPIRL